MKNLQTQSFLFFSLFVGKYWGEKFYYCKLIETSAAKKFYADLNSGVMIRINFFYRIRVRNFDSKRDRQSS